MQYEGLGPTSKIPDPAPTRPTRNVRDFATRNPDKQAGSVPPPGGFPRGLDRSRRPDGDIPSQVDQKKTRDDLSREVGDFETIIQTLPHQIPQELKASMTRYRELEARFDKAYGKGGQDHRALSDSLQGLNEKMDTAVEKLRFQVRTEQINVQQTKRKALGGLIKVLPHKLRLQFDILGEVHRDLNNTADGLFKENAERLTKDGSNRLTKDGSDELGEIIDRMDNCCQNVHDRMQEVGQRNAHWKHLTETVRKRLGETGQRIFDSSREQMDTLIQEIHKTYDECIKDVPKPKFTSPNKDNRQAALEVFTEECENFSNLDINLKEMKYSATKNKESYDGKMEAFLDIIGSSDQQQHLADKLVQEIQKRTIKVEEARAAQAESSSLNIIQKVNEREREIKNSKDFNAYLIRQIRKSNESMTTDDKTLERRLTDLVKSRKKYDTSRVDLEKATESLQAKALRAPSLKPIPPLQALRANLTTSMEQANQTGALPTKKLVENLREKEKGRIRQVEQDIWKSIEGLK